MNRSRKDVTCVLNPKKQISDNCKDCLCSTGVYTCKEIFNNDFYKLALENRNFAFDKDLISNHLKVLDANIRLYKNMNKNDYFTEDRDSNEYNIFHSKNFLKNLPEGPILIIGALYDSFDKINDRELVYMDLPLANDASNLMNVQADGILLPFRNEYFAGVFMSHVAHHLYDPFLLYQESFRVVKTNGCVKSCGDPNRKLPPVRKPGFIHKAYRGIYWGLRLLFDKYLQLQYPPRSIGRDSYYSQDIVNLAEYHDMGIYVERGFDSRQFKKRLETLGGKSIKISFTWDFPIKLPLIHKIFLSIFLIFGFGRESCFENITIEVIK